MIEISTVRADADVQVVKTLIYEFVDWLGERYPELEDTIKTYFSNQGFETEMDDLLSVFGPPGGECLLARKDGSPVGILMMKPHGAQECEMNRMFVQARARRNGIGEAMGRRLILAASDLGYDRMILSGLDKHYEALPLYRKLGFVEESREPDSGDVEHEVCMALDLTKFREQ